MSQSYSHYERQQTYRTIERILANFRRDDVALAQMIRTAEPDGFPGGSGRGGQSPGEHSDPTGATVARECTSPRCRFIEKGDHAPDPATHAFLELQEAFHAFALPPRAEEEPPKVDEAKTSKVDGEWCTSCLRGTTHDGLPLLVPRTTRTGGRRDLCDWCQGEWLGSGNEGRRRLPDPRLCVAHSEGVRLTADARARVLSVPQVARRKQTA